MATAVHPPQVRRNLSLECAGVCCLDAVPRDLCACALPTRPSPALWLLRLSSLKHSVGRLPWGGLELGSVDLALAAAPHTSLSRRCAATAALGQAPPPTTPSLCCGTLLLSPSPAAPPRLLLLSCGERPASPLSARRPALHPRALPVRRARLCALLGLGGGTPSAYDSVSLAVALSAPRPTRLSPPLSCGERAAPSLSARRSPPQRSRAAVFARCLGVWRDTLLPTITSYLSLAAGPSPLSRDR